MHCYFTDHIINEKITRLNIFFVWFYTWSLSCRCWKGQNEPKKRYTRSRIYTIVVLYIPTKFSAVLWHNFFFGHHFDDPSGTKVHIAPTAFRSLSTRHFLCLIRGGGSYSYDPPWTRMSDRKPPVIWRSIRSNSHFIDPRLLFQVTFLKMA